MQIQNDVQVIWPIQGWSEPIDLQYHALGIHIEDSLSGIDLQRVDKIPINSIQGLCMVGIYQTGRVNFWKKIIKVSFWWDMHFLVKIVSIDFDHFGNYH